MSALQRIEPSASPWYADHNELASLVAWLDETRGVTISDVRELLDAPWHFDTEFDAMCKERREL